MSRLRITWRTVARWGTPGAGRQTRVWAGIVCASAFVVSAVGCGAGLRAVRDDRTQVRDLVVSAREAALARHDIAHYMSQWADEARLEVARGEGAGRYDLIFNRAQIEALAVQRYFGWPPKDRVVTIEGVEVQVSGDEAAVATQVTVRESNGYETTAERSWLRRGERGWKVYRQRVWPLRTRIGPEEYVFDGVEWKRRDDEVHRQRKAGNRTLEVVALLEAWRFREAWRAARAATEGGRGQAMLWVMRGIAAVSSGNFEDAPRAFRTAVVKDPKVALPPYKAAMEAALADRKRRKAAGNQPAEP